jgi:hypothetical protein
MKAIHKEDVEVEIIKDGRKHYVQIYAGTAQEGEIVDGKFHFMCLGTLCRWSLDRFEFPPDESTEHHSTLPLYKNYTYTLKYD